MLCDIRRHCSMAFNREPCQKRRTTFRSFSFPVNFLLFLSAFSTPVSISQLAPASHERSHFVFAVASRVSCAAVEVCDEVAFLVDAWLKRTGQYKDRRKVLSKYYQGVPNMENQNSPSLLAPVSLVYEFKILCGTSANFAKTVPCHCTICSRAWPSAFWKL